VRQGFLLPFVGCIGELSTRASPVGNLRCPSLVLSANG
jgi:hypothetical protein